MTLDAALSYVRQGLFPIPIPYRTKIPTITGWDKLRLTEATAPKYFNGQPINVGILLGPSGLVDVDVDALDALPLARRLLPPTRTFGRASKQRSHFVYRVEGAGTTKQFKCPDRGDMIAEYRAKGGQTIFPPSTHLSGEGIAWDTDSDSFAVVDAAELRRAVGRVAAAVLLVRAGLAEDDAIGIVSSPQPPLAARLSGRALSVASKWLGCNVAPNSTQRTGGTNVVDRARAYLARLDPAVSKKGGHPQTLWAAIVLVRGFLLSDSDALSLMLDWNTRCQPPWERYDLERKIEEAHKADRLSHADGWLLNEQTHETTGETTGETTETGGGTTTPARGAIPAHFTDLGNAECLVRVHGADLRYVPAWGKWLTWTGARWETDETGRVARMAASVVRSFYTAASACNDESKRVALAKHATSSEARSRLDNMIALARNLHGIPIAVSDLDSDPLLLNTPSGVVNLKTGEVRPARREDLATKMTLAPYSPDATAPRWESFLQEILPDPEVRAYLQRLCGYALTGVIREHVLPVAWGGGGNGKGAMLGTYSRLLGDYATTVHADMLVARTNEAHPTERASLLGARLALASETEEGQRLAESLVKALTGGDKISARYMKKDFFEFEPTHKLILLTNHKPTVRGTDHGIWRRLQLIPFTVTIPESKVDLALPDTLLAEGAGILRWAVEGCLAWQRDGLRPPDAVKAATTSYRVSQDFLADFIADECSTTDPYARENATDLFSAYRRWCDENGHRVVSGRAFGLAMTERGFERIKVRGVKVYQGIRLARCSDTATADGQGPPRSPQGPPANPYKTSQGDEGGRRGQVLGLAGDLNSHKGYTQKASPRSPSSPQTSSPTSPQTDVDDGSEEWFQ